MATVNGGGGGGEWREMDPTVACIIPFYFQIVQIGARRHAFATADPVSSLLLLVLSRTVQHVVKI